MYNKQEFIKKIIDISYHCKGGHVPSSLSVLDIIYVLYNNILNIKDIKELQEDRDRFILSKGHASLALYTVLKDRGLLEEDLYSFGQYYSKLGGHPTNKIKYVEATTGSLGHGFPMAVGLAMGYKINSYKSRIYTIIGDGESNEGTIWESAMLASQYQLDNLYCILDYNKSGNRALSLNNIMDRFRSFGWFCCEVDGHDHEKLEYALNNKNANKQPIFILANTIKGCGCKLMENTTEWHHKHPNEEEYKKLMETIY